MRATVFFIFLCSLFLFNGTHAVINKAHLDSVCHCSSTNQNIEQPYSIGNSTDLNRFIEESDLDSTEENNIKSNLDKSNKIASLSGNLVNQWEIEFLGLVILKNDFKGFKNFKPYFTYSQPLYILLRVLRI